jgi:hypothetical protein
MSLGVIRGVKVAFGVKAVLEVFFDMVEKGLLD